MIKQEFLDELLSTQAKLEDMYLTLAEHIVENDKCEGKYVDGRHPIYEGNICNVTISNGKVDVTTFGFNERDECYDEGGYVYPINKLLSDDWKEAAIKKYQQELETKRQKEEQKKAEEEKREREEYERLKAKYG